LDAISESFWDIDDETLSVISIDIFSPATFSP